jgi:translation initiation factor 4E
MMVTNKHYSGSYIYLFRKGIKPIWEDKANVGGGSFVILADKAKANKMWEDVLLSFITAQDIAAPINGLRLKIKKEVAHIDVRIL